MMRKIKNGSAFKYARHKMNRPSHTAREAPSHISFLTIASCPVLYFYSFLRPLMPVVFARELVSVSCDISFMPPTTKLRSLAASLAPLF